MVARSYLLSLLAVVATFASSVAALPQEDAPVPPASELESVPVELDTPAADARPVPGAESNTLLDVAPELGRLANEEPNPAARMTKREANPLEKRDAQCGLPGVGAAVWNILSQKMCEKFFPNPRLAYFVQEGRCLTGYVAIRRPHIPHRLNFKCCAKSCGAHVSFVGVTQPVCKALFRKAVAAGSRKCRRLPIRSADSGPAPRDPMVCSFWAT